MNELGQSAEDRFDKHASAAARLGRDLTAPRMPSASGAMVMAFGIFAAASLRQIPGGASATKPAAIVVLGLWLWVVAKLLVSMRQWGISTFTKAPLGWFGIGTWVAGTAVVGQVTMLAWPAVIWLSASFLLGSFALWLLFLPMAVGNLAHLAADRSLRPSGVILLTTVATQSVAIADIDLLGEATPARLAAMLIWLGAAAYVAGVYLVLRRYWLDRDWCLAADWDNTNCILHGALSITGLAAVLSRRFEPSAVFAVWVGALAAFAMVELVEAARLSVRFHKLGWRQGVWAYDPSQWARNFTFGMLVAFTQAYAGRMELSQAHPVLRALRGFVLAYGPYVVLLLLVVELLLMLTASAPELAGKGDRPVDAR